MIIIIINPKSDGIRYSSVKTKNNLIAANVIINSGNFDVYENDNTRFNGEDAYVETPYDNTDFVLKNNYFDQDLSSLEFKDGYSLVTTSSLISARYSGGFTPKFDFNLDNRLVGGFADIGAFECENPVEIIENITSEKFSLIYSNPVSSNLNLQINVDSIRSYAIKFYNLKGQILFQENMTISSIGKYNKTINVLKWPYGLYLCVVKSETLTQVHEFCIIASFFLKYYTFSF